MERIDCTILGKSFSLACPAEKKEALTQAITQVTELTHKIQESTKAATPERIAIMAAIQLADELLSLKSPDGPLGSFALSEYKRKIDVLGDVLDNALTQQDSLL